MSVAEKPAKAGFFVGTEKCGYGSVRRSGSRICRMHSSDYAVVRPMGDEEDGFPGHAQDRKDRHRSPMAMVMPSQV